MVVAEWKGMEWMEWREREYTECVTEEEPRRNILFPFDRVGFVVFAECTPFQAATVTVSK